MNNGKQEFKILQLALIANNSKDNNAICNQKDFRKIDPYSLLTAKKH